MEFKVPVFASNESADQSSTGLGHHLHNKNDEVRHNPQFNQASAFGAFRNNDHASIEDGSDTEEEGMQDLISMSSYTTMKTKEQASNQKEAMDIKKLLAETGINKK